MKLFISDFKRTMTSMITYVSIVGVAAICIFGAVSDGTKYVVQCFWNTMFISSYRNLIVFFASIPYCATFCNEWKSNNTYYIIGRTSVKKYLISHIVTQALITFIISFLGLIIGVLVMNLFIPEFCDTTNVYTGAFMHYINSGESWKLIFFLIYHYSISVSAWSISGLFVSSVFIDPYIAIGTPIVMSYVFEMFTIGSGRYTDLWMLSLSYCTISDNPIIVSSYITLVFIIIGALFALSFYNIAKRRIRCDIV